MSITERINTKFLSKFKNYKDHGDYNCWGFEAIMNLSPEYDDFIDRHNHLPKGFETWLYYAPSDYRMVLIDFSNVDKGTINLVDGTYYHTKERELIKTLTLQEFLDEYGTRIIRSVGHWKVYWNTFGIGWDN